MKYRCTICGHIYDENVEEITWNIVKRRDNNELEENEILYKKNRCKII